MCVIASHWYSHVKMNMLICNTVLSRDNVRLQQLLSVLWGQIAILGAIIEMGGGKIGGCGVKETDWRVTLDVNDERE